eukprot:Nitzschia sp. Nitz4//scaffold148_size54725//1297//4518//NITZ4_006650-RA/size54725-snap-gene-0.90-mRNA-1//-1//CDS//3329536724//1336//frame0
MAKKKKGRSSLQPQPPQAQASTNNATNASSGIRKVSELSLQVVPVSKQTSSRRQFQAKSPLFQLTPEDANQLGFVSGQSALLWMSNHQSDCISTAVAQVQVLTNHPHTPKSAARPQLSPGSCHVLPESLWSKLRVVSETSSSSKSSVPPTPSSASTFTPSKPPPSTSSTPTPKKFSFKTFVNESPQKPVATPDYKSTTSSKRLSGMNSVVQVRVVPMSSDLGSQLASLLCRPAHCLQFHILEDAAVVSTSISDMAATSNSTSTSNIVPTASQHLQDVSRILQGPLGTPLLQSQFLNTYITSGMECQIALQGKQIPCRVYVQHDPLEVASFSLSRLTLQDKASPEVVEGDLHKQPPSDLVTLVRHSMMKDPTFADEVSVSKVMTAAQKESNVSIRLWQCTCDTSFSVVLGTDSANSIDTSKTATSQSSAPLVVGLDDVVHRVQRLIFTPFWMQEAMQEPSPTSIHEKTSFHKALKPPRGILLYGPSGSGKTALCRQLMQELQQQHQQNQASYQQTGSPRATNLPNLHVNFVSCANLHSQTMLAGQAEQELVSLFEQASRRHPGTTGTLLILDDIHLIGARRRGMKASLDRVTSTLLSLLDGVLVGKSNQGDRGTTVKQDVQKTTPVVLLAVTTDLSLLDPALRRPGRLDTEVEVSLPETPGIRQQILRHHLNRMGGQLQCERTVPNFYYVIGDEENCDGTDNWLEFGRFAKGFSGADLQLAAKEALRLAFQRQKAFTDTVSLNKQDLIQAIRSTKPSAIKAVSVEIPQVPWSSIGGMDQVKRELKRAIEFPLNYAAKFQQLGIRPPRGILLYGPPGCSKTLMARALATEGHMNFLAVKGPELLSKWLGESERALASLFRRARLASPSVIFFDEVDAIASKRGGSASSGGGERLLSQLLTELDGIRTKTDEHVMVVCATNRPDLLDGALLRAGRIDRMIYVGIPDMESRQKILEICLCKGGVSKAVNEGKLDFHWLAQDAVSGGLSGAEIVTCCRNAALSALEESEELQEHGVGARKLKVDMHHIERALVTMERQITKELLRYYADFQG